MPTPITFDYAGVLATMASALKDAPTGVVTDDDKAIATRGALDRYSRDRKLRRPLGSEELPTGNGTRALPLPAFWESGFSTVDWIDYPVGPEGRTRYAVESEETWEVDPSAGGGFYTFGFLVPDGTPYRIAYTAPHRLKDFPEAPTAPPDPVDPDNLTPEEAAALAAYEAQVAANVTTIAESDFQAVACLAAANVLQVVVDHLAQLEDPGTGSGLIDQSSKTEVWRQIRRDWEARYTIKPATEAGASQVVPADATTVLEPSLSTGGQPFHRRLRRYAHVN